MGERLSEILGMEPMAHRPPLVWRFWIYSASAFLLPVVIQIGFPEDPSSMDDLVWLVTLVPAFILSLHYGLRGAFVALILGTALLVTVQVVLSLQDAPDDPRIIVPIYIAYGMLAISVGWLSEELHEHYETILELRAKQKTDSLGKLAAGIAHDFNNVLTAMTANAELMAGRGDEDDRPVPEELEQLKSAAERGAGMVRNLLGLSRRGLLSLRPLDLTELIEELRPRIRGFLPESVALEIEIDPDVPVVAGDRDAVEQILLGVIDNARDAMPLGGRLRVEIRSGRLDFEHLERRGWGEPGEYVVVSVADSGVGMDEEGRRRVFEPFYTTKEAGEGIGLGMAIVYGLMKQHRGFVDVRSTEGEGTTVLLYFPVTRGHAEPEESEAAREPAERDDTADTILVVEDEEAIRRAAERILARFGYRVETASDGDEALAAYERLGDRIALVLCDVVLPERSGPEFYETIRRREPPPPFLFMSGYPAADLESGVALDPDLPFIAKPWTVDGLVEAVREVLDEDPGGGESAEEGS